MPVSVVMIDTPAGQAWSVRKSTLIRASGRSMTNPQPNNPLHGITLEAMLNRLVEHYGWEGVAEVVRVRCFQHDPSIKSSLKFLRRTPWARQKVERLYLKMMASEERG